MASGSARLHNIFSYAHLGLKPQLSQIGSQQSFSSVSYTLFLSTKLRNKLCRFTPNGYAPRSL